MKRIVVATMLAVAAGLAGAADPDASDVPEFKAHTQSGIKYVSGGIGEQYADILELGPRYPMHLVFKVDGKHVEFGGIKVRLFDVMGRLQVEADSDGPVFYLNPPSGRWTIEAEWQGQKIKQTKDLTGRRYLELEFDFKS